MPHTPKLANDHNRTGNQEPTQTNQGRRTPQSRHERQTTAGGPMNVVQARTGGKGGGRGPRGGGTVARLVAADRRRAGPLQVGGRWVDGRGRRQLSATR